MADGDPALGHAVSLFYRECHHVVSGEGGGFLPDHLQGLGVPRRMSAGLVALWKESRGGGSLRQLSFPCRLSLDWPGDGVVAPGRSLSRLAGDPTGGRQSPDHRGGQACLGE